MMWVLLSRSHSHRSSHLSIISFLLSVSCSSFSLIWTQTWEQQLVCQLRRRHTCSPVGHMTMVTSFTWRLHTYISSFLFHLFQCKNIEPVSTFEATKCSWRDNQIRALSEWITEHNLTLKRVSATGTLVTHRCWKWNQIRFDLKRLDLITITPDV